MLGESEEAKRQFEELARQEMEVWKSMMSGAAVMEHMEDKYHDMLKARARYNRAAKVLNANGPIFNSPQCC
jgi:hypothetical protein